MVEKAKSRVSYDKDLRAEAKAAGQGLITISVTQPNGERIEYQVAGNAEMCRFAKWAGVCLGEDEVRPCLETIVQEYIENDERND